MSPVPKPTMLPMNGTTSARTDSGARTIEIPTIMTTNPTNLRSHVIVVFSASACLNISSADTFPPSSRSIVVPARVV